MESISRISSMLETARDLTLEASSTVRSKPPSRTLPSAQIKKLLSSRSERDILDGLRRTISLAYSQQPQSSFQPSQRGGSGDVSQYLSPAIKNISSPNPTIRKLTYQLLLLCAASAQDTTLLSINSLQKSLSDPSPPLRALALRTMSTLPTPLISQIVLLAIKRGMSDMSPLVRRTAALACVKAYRLDPGTLPQLEEHLEKAVGDREYYVAGAGVAAFVAVCGGGGRRVDVVHKYYRGLVRKLVDMDEWGQAATIGMLTGYARKCFPRRTRRVKKSGGGNAAGMGKNSDTTKGFYEDEEEAQPKAHSQPETEEEVIDYDPDLLLFLNALLPLLHSRNSAVITAVARAYLTLTAPNSTYLHAAIGPLISLLRASQDIHQIALHNLVRICLVLPDPFLPYLSHFLFRASEPVHTARLKLELLTLLFPHAPPHLRGLILSELRHFSSTSDPMLVREAVRAIGRCASSGSIGSDTSSHCLSLLLAQLSSPHTHLVSESLDVIRHLIQRSPASHHATVIRLAANLDTLTSSQARACIIWLVGEYAAEDIAADVLRLLVRGFGDESEAAKSQIVLLAAKCYVRHLNLTNPPREAGKPAVGKSPTPEATEMAKSPFIAAPEEEGGFVDNPFNDEAKLASAINTAAPEDGKTAHPIAMLWSHILLLARYDTSYDLRDRARLYKALLAVPSSTELATLLLLAPKPVPRMPSPSESRANFTLGSASLVIGEEGGMGGLKGYEEIPEWVEEGQEPDARLRDDGVVGYREEKAVSASERLDSAIKTSGVSSAPRKANGVGKEKTLDDWLAEDEGSEEDEEEDDETEEESEEESSEEESSGEEETDEDEDENDRLVR
ncbi:ARM repeat-containing protein [Aulographum hederae CBS 113979]|uniref:ARM repeat-containing protein n=1 Tax=Aulographum hederae CBS 113979 TaxID=1176131 RepID=A0A6G1HCT3_9PEZI|nr:ARM repeat-containing protein [Aulographum hederae CBS 113979]